MRMSYRIVQVLWFLTLFIPGGEAIKIGSVDWSINFTPAQRILLITAGVAHESETVLNVWDKCYGHMDGPLFIGSRHECLMAIRAAVIRCCLAFAAFDMFTRCHEPKNLDHRLVDVGGISGIKLDLYTNSTTLVRRNDIAAEFNVSGISVLYTPQMYEAAVAGTADQVLLGTDNKDKSIPLTMLEVNYNGTWIINPLERQKFSDSDSTLYTSGKNSMIIECQYCTSEIYDNEAFAKLINAMDREQNIDAFFSPTYILYHDYIGSNLHLECAKKTHSPTKELLPWQAWNEVWSSF